MVVGTYEVQVYDQVVMAGNHAVLRCAVPPYVQEYVHVAYWSTGDAARPAVYPGQEGTCRGGVYVPLYVQEYVHAAY